MDELSIASLLASTLRVSVPLILCALAGTLSERSGVIDLGLEGKMLLCAFAAGSVGAVSGSMTLALLAAVAVGVALSMLHGYACVSHRDLHGGIHSFPTRRSSDLLQARWPWTN